MTKHILMVAGGTGGHVFPALAIAEQLKAKGFTVSWLGVAGKIEEQLIPVAGYQLTTIDVSGVTGVSILQKIKAILQTAKAIFTLRKFIKKQNIDAVFCMGGYLSVSAGYAAKFCKRKVYLHEQNSVLGIANKLIAKFADQSFAAFPSAFDKFFAPSCEDYTKQKQALLVGQPLRSHFTTLDRQAQLSRFQRLDDPNYVPLLLIMGGSLGAQVINQILPQALQLLASDEHKQLRLRVLHQTGKNKEQATLQAYQQADFKGLVDYQIVPFIDDVAAAYDQADFIICRSGAITVFELAAAIVPAIFIPFQHRDKQQLLNAQYLVEKNCATVIEQAQLTRETLAQQIKNYDKHRIKWLAENLYNLPQNNAVELIVNFLQQQFAQDKSNKIINKKQKEK